MILSMARSGGSAMHVHIVHAHPEPTSFNGALTRITEQTLTDLRHGVTVSDLYDSGFDPVECGTHYAHQANAEAFAPLAEQRHAWRTDTLPADVRQELRNLERADLVILQFPLWWHGPPAMLKGWFDRVFVSGGIYTSSMRYDTGYFRGRRAMVSVTTGAPEEAFGHGARGGDFDTMLWPVHYSLHYLGFSVLPPFVSYGIQGHGYAYRDADDLAEHLDRTVSDWRSRLSRLTDLDALSFPGWNDWDGVGQPKGRSEGPEAFGQAGRTAQDAQT